MPVSKDSLIQAAFLRQRALEQQHESKLEYGFEHKQERELTTGHGQNTEAEITSLGEDQKPIVIMAGSSNLTGIQANLLSPSNNCSDRSDECSKSQTVTFSADKFTGEGGEDVEEFLESVRLSFVPNEAYYRDDQDREKARLLYLASRLEGAARKWWKKVDREKRNTWTKALAEMMAEFDVKEEEDITA